MTEGTEGITGPSISSSYESRIRGEGGQKKGNEEVLEWGAWVGGQKREERATRQKGNLER